MSNSINQHNKKKQYNILNDKEKEKIIKELKYSDINKVSKKYNIKIRTIKRWQKNGGHRKIGSGRKYKDPSLESKLIEWYNTHDKMTTHTFRNVAKAMSNNPSFMASYGWLTKMKKKYDLKFQKY